MKTLTISICVLFLVMMSALPVSATPELYFGDVKTLEDGSKIVSLMVGDVNNLGSCDVIIEITTSGVEVTGVTSGDENALTVQASDIDNIDNTNTKGSVTVTAWDVSTAHSGNVVISNIIYKGSDSNPFEIHSAQLFDYTNYNEILHTGNNEIDRSTVKPTGTKAADDSATSVATISGGEADGEGVVAESTEIADVTKGSSWEDNRGIPGFGLLTGLSVMLIAIRFLREDK
jgi:hypothetical protein